MTSKEKRHSFTLKSNGLSRVLLTPILILPTFKNSNNKQIQVNAIWDTGATSSVISPKVVEACNLISSGKDKVHTAGGTSVQNVYLVDIYLPNGILVKSVRVTEAKEIAGADALIGMDIISLGDFAISNVDKKTVFSFRIPSKKVFDFVEDSKKYDEMVAKKEHREMELMLKKQENQPCPCGSGRKYKYCCAKKEKQQS